MRIVGIIRIFGIFGISKLLIDLPLYWQNKEYQVIISRIFGI